MEEYFNKINKKQPFVQPLDKSPGDICPETRLWRRVIFLFLIDFQKELIKFRGSLNGNRRPLIRRLEVFFNISKHKWTEQMCEFADVDYVCFIEFLHKMARGDANIDLYKYNNDDY